MGYNLDLQLKISQQANSIIDTLPRFAYKFFNSLRDQGMSERTRLQYAYDMQRFFGYLQNQPSFKDVNFKSATAEETIGVLTLDDIQEYISTLQTYTRLDKHGQEVTKLASPAIKARRVSSLRSFYKYYFKIGEIKSNLAELIDVPSIPDHTIKVMSKEDVERILAVVKDTEGMNDKAKARHEKIMKRDYAIMMLFFGTGLRVSELVGIDTYDIDFYNASILVTRKGGDQDEVFFGPEVEDALLDYYDNERSMFVKPGNEEGPFFLSRQYSRISVRSVETLIKSYAKKAGLNMSVTPHTLRRTFGTNLYEETSDIYLVADALHHSSVETTRKHYAQMSKDHKRIAAKKSSSLFKKG